VVSAKQKSKATFVYLLAKINGLMSVNILLSHHGFACVVGEDVS